MALKCFMCGAAISRGILCEKCDKPRKKSGEQPPVASEQRAASSEQAPPPAPARPATHTPAPMPPIATAATAPAALPEEFPKAPVLQFPVESASPA